MIWEQSKGKEWADGIVGMQGIFVLKTYIQKNLSQTLNTCINFNVQHAIKWSFSEENIRLNSFEPSIKSIFRANRHKKSSRKKSGFHLSQKMYWLELEVNQSIPNE